jgi:hypothetical protein
LVYAVAVWVGAAAFVHWYEEPAFARRFGSDYENYRRAVPAWWRRLHPWSPDESDLGGEPRRNHDDVPVGRRPTQ